MLDDQELAAARRSVINAHYTDAALVQTIWDGVAMLGFTGGQVLEPGCGAGNFIAFAPETAAITGIELDPTTAAIAAALHPPARILAESFADTRIGTGSFALAIGNVPFGDVRLYDKRDNRGHHAIHNHCILKSLRAIRPGGLVAVITSAYTMDAANPAARREMRQLADLVGAVRLPSRVHARAAGTNALTDLLVFRRREEHRDPAPFGWEYSTTIDVDQVPVRVNTYFVEHPQRVLGRFAVGDGLYRRDEVSVTGDPAAAPTQLRQALVQLAAEAHQTNLTMTPGRSPSATAQPAALLPSSEGPPDNSLRANTDGTFSRFGAEQWQPYAPPKTQAGELRALLGLRDTAVALLQAEAASLDDTEDIDRLRAELNTRYDAYAAAHGPINRFTEVLRHRKDPETGRMVAAVDEETGQPLLRRNRPPQGRFRTDPFAPVVRALEHFDEAAQTATKPAIFTHRVIAPRPPRLGADTPADALAICVDDHGEVRLPTIAWLMGVDEDTARRQLGALVYDDPATGRLEPAAAYLSGDVKSKLATARAAADTDERYTANVTALAEAVPPDLNPEEITATGAVKMGAPWIGAAYVQRFLAEILDDPTVRVEYGGGAMWAVNSHRDHTVAATSTWGTDRRCAAEIAQTIVEQREFVITDTVGHGTTKRRVVNLDATVAATEKAAEMRERFADWIWEDDARSAALVAAYNDTFQRYVHRTYDDVQLSLPGLAMAFRPDAHQRAAVARIIHEPAVGLYHVVGAGKTATMVMGAMELRRLGLVHKPVVVVPNQLLDQWSRDFLTLYPQAKILTASTEDLAKERRRLVVAQMATGDWDAVILTEDAFAMLPMSPDGERAYVDRQLTQLDERIGVARANGAELTLKRLETMKLNRAAGLRERLDTDQDAGIWWELTGIDYLFRDESHRDKNLRTVSNVPGMSIRGSQRAQQMDLKLAWTRERHPRWGTRATGTPIANSIGELFTEYRYLRPDLMERQGITDIDSWLATYAEGAVIIEVTPDGGGLRNKTRLNFVNLEKLADSLHVFADVKTKDDLDLHRPLLAARADGQRLPEAVVVRPSAELLDKIAELLDKIAELVERAAKLRGKRPQKGRDNILAIVGEGSAAALDLRLVGLTTDAAQKLDVAADRIAARYHVTRDRRYLAHDGQPHPRPGALQMVFCDLGTPSAKDPGRWSAYAELRTKLVARGMPRETIRFVHDATDDRQRAELFAACRDGRVAVLVGSTEKMGTGVNVQDRLLSLHHLDCPWRPCDLQQREGRIDRRGNQNPEIFIDRYVTERSLDSFKYQKIAYKAGLADQVLTGKAGSRSEDVGEATLSYEEIKAAATGNPLLVDHAKTKAELARLERLQRGYQRNLRQLRWTITNSRQDIGIAQATIAEADAAIIRRRNTRGNAFTMTIRATTYAKRGEANDRLKTVLGLILADPRNGDGHPTDVGELGGFTITATVEGLARGHGAVDGLRVRLRDVPGAELRIGDEDLTGGDLVTRLENRLGKLEILRDEAVADIGRREAEIVRAEHDLTRPFRHQDQLSEARAHFQHLDAQVTALATASEAEANTGADDTDDTDEPAESEETIALGDAGHGEGGMSPAPGRTIGGTDTFRRSPTPTEASTARSAADASPEPVLEPATSMDASAAAMSPEQRLMRRAAARVPQDSVLWPSVDGDHPAVRLDSVANGTYGQVTGVDLDRQPITVAGYVMQARALSGGIGGWSRSPVMVVKLGDLPDGPVVHTVQTDPDARLTVRDPPEATMPAGEDAPWLRMSVEEQILSARSVLGLGIEVLDGPHHELWQVEGCPHQLTGEVASWLFDGRYGSWDGRARPAFRPERLDEAFVAGRIQPDRQRPPAVASWNDRIQITVGRSTIVTGTTGNPKEAGLRGLLKQHRFRYHRSDGQWRYTGRREDRHAAIGDIQRWLDAQDRADEAKAEAYPRVPQFPPTEQQQAIIDAYLAGKSIAVQALAGTGKTATLLMLANARPDARIAYIAFNRSIADEAQRKFGRNVRAETSHAFAREGLVGTPIQAKLARVGQGARWSEEWARHLGITAVAGEPPVEPETMARMAMACVRSFRESAAETITAAHLPQHVVEGQPGLAGRVLDHAKAAWRDITDPAGHLLFDHDDYLKIWALGHPRLSYDVVFFDEAQDINDVLREVIQQQPQQTIVVGDSNQSIYGFRGAIDALKRWPADLTLPLTQSWRFGPAVAEAGNQFLALLHSPLLLSGNPTLRSSIGIVEQPDAILARTNAGAVSAVFASFDNDRRVALMGGGRAIEEIAKAAKDLQAGRGTQHPDLARFSDWEEARAYVEEGEDAQSLRAFVRLVDRRGADGLLQMVTELVNEDETDLDGNPAYDVIVSTVHKAKGREWAQLRIAEDFPQPQENLATRQVVLPNDEQLRLAYVAVTRARQRLELGSLSWIGDVAATADRTAGLEPQPTALADEASDTCDAAVQAERQAAARLARLDTASGIPVGPTTPRNAHGSRAASVAVGTADSAAHWFNRAPRC